MAAETSAVGAESFADIGAASRLKPHPPLPG